MPRYAQIMETARLQCREIKHPDHWLNKPQKRLGMNASFEDALCEMFHSEYRDNKGWTPGSATLAYCRLMTGSDEKARELRYALADKIHTAYGEEILLQQSEGQIMPICNPEDDSRDDAAEEAEWQGLRQKIRRRIHGMAQTPGHWQEMGHSDLCLESFDHALHKFISMEEESGDDREPDSLTQQYCRLMLSDAGRELRDMVFAHIAARNCNAAGHVDHAGENRGA